MIRAAYQGRKRLGDDCYELLAKCAQMVPLEEADIAFSVLGSRIYAPEEIEAVSLGIINLHLAPLPAYRGFYAFSHAIANGETDYCVTLHYVDEGIDTGPIIATRGVPILPDDTPETLGRRASGAGRVLFRNVLPWILEDAERGERSPAIEQVGEGHYYGRDSLPPEQRL